MDSFALPISHPGSGLEDFIAISRYARYSPDLRRRETWVEAVDRVRDMHLAHYADTSLGDAALAAMAAGDVTPEDLSRIGRLGRLHETIRSAFAAAERREVLPSMRSLQFGGEAILKKHAVSYTHLTLPTKRIV